MNLVVRRLLFDFLVDGSADVFFFFKIEKYISIFYRLFILILSCGVTILASLILKQRVQGLQAFAFRISTVNDEQTKQTYVQNKA